MGWKSKRAGMELVESFCWEKAFHFLRSRMTGRLLAGTSVCEGLPWPCLVGSLFLGLIFQNGFPLPSECICVLARSSGFTRPKNRG